MREEVLFLSSIAFLGRKGNTISSNLLRFTLRKSGTSMSINSAKAFTVGSSSSLENAEELSLTIA